MCAPSMGPLTMMRHERAEWLTVVACMSALLVAAAGCRRTSIQVPGTDLTAREAGVLTAVPDAATSSMQDATSNVQTGAIRVVARALAPTAARVDVDIE